MGEYTTCLSRPDDGGLYPLEEEGTYGRVPKKEHQGKWTGPQPYVKRERKPKMYASYAISNCYTIFPPNTMQFSLYVTHLSTKEALLSTFKTLKAVMPFYYAARNSTETPVTQIPYVELLLDGPSRAAAKNRGLTKAASLDQVSLREVLIFTMWPTGSEFSPSRCL